MVDNLCDGRALFTCVRFADQLVIVCQCTLVRFGYFCGIYLAQLYRLPNEVMNTETTFAKSGSRTSALHRCNYSQFLKE